MKKLFMAALLSTTLGVSSSVMAVGNPQAGQAKAESCAACHGPNGNSPMEAFPNLAGQAASYIVKQLQDYKSGARENALMSPMAAGLSVEDMADIAAYYARQQPTLGAVPEELVELGEQIYRGGNPNTGVPACIACHGPSGRGMPAAAWPALSGQHSAYVEEQLHAFANGTRHNDPNEMMRDIAKKMSAEEIRAVSAYVRGLH